MAEQHISSNFDRELDSIHQYVARMGELCKSSLDIVMDTLFNADELDLDRILQHEVDINQLNVTIDAECQAIIARRQPTASDLRFIITMSRVSIDLERIGDEIKKIAFIMQDLLDNYHVTTQEMYHTYRLSTLTMPMMNRALNAFHQLDTSAFAELREMDNFLDQDYREQIRIISTYMVENPQRISIWIWLMMINKSLERVGDHCKNISEHIIYLVEAVDVRHQNVSNNH
ncbi:MULTISPECIES: phosphate signaling complex protein PhoU [unclassified Acinetobacter]|uniref:phosphate signaling complex protein PhoU n=1 Tax=unclassified Acinetobacter TaxID=196816 RepID=UPI0035B9561F